MEPLIPITGYAKTYEELCNKVAYPGEYFNVLDKKPFTTYHKLDEVEIGDTNETTDVLGWYKNKAELESNEHLVEGEVYITGTCEPYTRWKAQYVNYVLQLVEDGEEEKKIVRHFNTTVGLGKAKLQPEEGIYYSVGKELPYKIFGVVSSWELVGSYISHVVDNMNQLIRKPTKSNPGEIAYMKGIYYLYTGNGWEPIDIPEPMENVYKHSYYDGDKKFKIREGFTLGTLEFYSPKG